MDHNQREQYLLAWQRDLLEKHNEIVNRQNDIRLYENDLFLFEDYLKKEEENLKNNHCICCRFNNHLPLNQPDTFCGEWGIFRRSKSGVEARIGVSSIGEVHLSQTFLSLFDKWLKTETGKNYTNSQLIAIYVTKLDLNWSASDWRSVDDFNSKLIICEKSGRHRIKFIIK